MTWSQAVGDGEVATSLYSLTRKTTAIPLTLVSQEDVLSITCNVERSHII